MSYWKANPHPWGPGRVHVLHPVGVRTLCGKKLSECPGRYIPETAEYDCRACAQIVAAEERRRESEQRWQQKSAEYERQREEKNREWWRRYRAYLESAEWKERRAAVLRRAKGICEGCGKRRATEVHHTPAAYRHLFHEPLFELVALCQECHEQVTAMDRNEPWQERREIDWDHF